MGEAARATCRHCRRPIIACDAQLSHVGCSSGYGWIHAEPYWGHPCSPPGHWRDYARPDAPATEEDDMTGLLTVTITWMDGKQETYTCHNAQEGNGVLYLQQPTYPDTGQPHRQFPIASIRTWTTEDR
jgi:hypothetical protein